MPRFVIERDIPEIGSAEREIKEAEAWIKKYKDQQIRVHNVREYDALTKDIQVQKQRIADARRQIEERG